MNLDNRIFADWKRSAENRVPDAPGLMVFHPEVTAPDFESVFECAAGPVLRLEFGKDPKRLRWNEIQVASTCSQSLPLQTGSMGLVMLSHVISAGQELELGEACRILKPGGVLLVLGYNRYGFYHLRKQSGSDVPGLRVLAVREQLEHKDMEVRTMLAAGFLNRQWPAQLNRGFSRILIPLGDLFLVVARKNEPRLATPIKRTQLRTVSAPSALAGP